MDETVNNGAQALYLKDLNITTERFSEGMVDNLTGLVVGAPYLCCAILGCWLTEPMNRLFARRGTVFISCLIAAIASIWEGVANSWVNLFIARFVLGLGEFAFLATFALRCPLGCVQTAAELDGFVIDVLTQRI